MNKPCIYVSCQLTNITVELVKQTQQRTGWPVYVSYPPFNRKQCTVSLPEEWNLIDIPTVGSVMEELWSHTWSESARMPVRGYNNWALSRLTPRKPEDPEFGTLLEPLWSELPDEAVARLKKFIRQSKVCPSNLSSWDDLLKSFNLRREYHFNEVLVPFGVSPELNKDLAERKVIDFRLLTNLIKTMGYMGSVADYVNYQVVLKEGYHAKEFIMDAEHDDLMVLEAVPPEVKVTMILPDQEWCDKIYKYIIEHFRSDVSYVTLIDPESRNQKALQVTLNF